MAPRANLNNIALSNRALNNTVKRLRTFGVVFLYLFITPAFAQSQNSSDELPTRGDELPTLTIEADAEAEVGQVEHEDYAGRYTRIDKNSLKRTDTELSDVLAFETGIQQQRVGGFGSFSSISVRASTASQTGIFLDGIKLNGASNAVIDLSLFDTRSFDSVDIYRGAAPLLLGSTNLGGAVNLNSASNDTTSSQVKFTAGSFGTLQTNLSHQANTNRWKTVASVDAGRSDNNFTLDNDNTTPLNPNDDTRERRNNAGVDSFALLAKAAYSHSDRVASDVLLQHTERATGVPEFRNSENNVASFEEGRGQLHASHRVSNFDGWTRRHTAFLQWSDDHFDDRLSQVGLGAQNFRSNQRVLGASTYWDQFTTGGKIALTAEIRQESFDSEDPFGRERDVNATRSSVTGGIAYTRFAFNESVIITPRLRLENHDSERDGQIIATQEIDSGLVLNPEISTRYDQSPELTWTASIGRYFRIPSFSEIFGTQGLIVSNDELVPESGVNTELGAQWSPSNELKLSATLFHSSRKDAIVTVFDARGIGRSLNSGSASIQGVELEAAWRPTNALGLKANVTIQDTNNESRISSSTGKQLPGQSAQTAYLRGEIDVRKHTKLWTEVNISRDRFFDLGNFLPAEDATTVNIGTQWQRNKLQADFTLSNITNEIIEDFNGFPRPGRSFSLGFSYRF